MSHFTEIKTIFQDRDTLIAALKSLKGWTAEYHDNPTNLYGYQNDRREQVANIIVRRSQISRASNDIGFIFNPENGGYDIIISDYDRGRFPTLVTDLQREYGMAVVQKYAEKHGMKIEKEILGNKVKVSLTKKVKVKR